MTKRNPLTRNCSLSRILSFNLTQKAPTPILYDYNRYNTCMSPREDIFTGILNMKTLYNAMQIEVILVTVNSTITHNYFPFQ